MLLFTAIILHRRAGDGDWHGTNCLGQEGMPRMLSATVSRVVDAKLNAVRTASFSLWRRTEQHSGGKLALFCFFAITVMAQAAGYAWDCESLEII